MNAQFSFLGTEFQIEKAEIYGTINRTVPSTVRWGVDIECAEKEIDDVPYSPSLDIEFIDLIERDWRQFEGKSLTFGKTARGTAYSFDHQKISNGQMLIGKFEEGFFEISGSCVDADDSEFCFKTKAFFPGVWVMCDESDDSESVRHRIESQVLLSDLKQQPIELYRKLDDGSKLGRCLFSPAW